MVVKLFITMKNKLCQVQSKIIQRLFKNFHMRPIRFILSTLFICVLISSHGQLLIKNVSIADVVTKKWLSPRDVLIADDIIKEIGLNLKATDGIQVIDGKGKFLIPGFVDAHIHFSQSGGVYTRPDAIDLRKYKPYDEEILWTHMNMEHTLRRYLAVGITTVVDVGSTLNFLRQRDTFKTKSFAPTIYMTGPLFTTWEPSAFKNLKDDELFFEMRSVEDAKKYVQKQLPFKPDFIKIWYIVQGRNTDSAARAHLPMVQAVIDESHKAGLRVAVHATERITAQLAVEAGADLLVHGIDDVEISDDFVKLLKTKKVVLTPTLVVMHGYVDVLGQTYKINQHDFKHASATQLNSIVDFKHLPDTALLKRYKTGIAANMPATKITDSLLTLNLKKLNAGGVTIATGTDAGNIGTQHASSYYHELNAMKQSGMNMWQLLQASTINGAKAVGKENDFGSIQKGKRADLLLLNKNPIDSLANWQSFALIINKGHAWNPDSISTRSPAELADQQLIGYNTHNLDFFLEPYSEDVEVYSMPAHALDIKGKASMRKAYEFVKTTPDLYCRILKRIVQGDTIVDHEEVYTGANSKPFYGIATYVVKNGKISRVYFY